MLASLDPSAGPDAMLWWKSPLAEDKFKEYRDVEFLDKVNLSKHSIELKKFWPKDGPCWDALAVVEGMNPQGVVLIEAKSHITEMASKCGAKSRDSLNKIQEALALTAKSLGVVVNTSWMEQYYQTANRYAHLQFIRNMGVPAWLVNVYFTEDKIGMTTLDEWQKALEEVREQLGLRGKRTPFTSELFLEAINT